MGQPPPRRLSEAGAELAGSLDRSETLDRLARLVVEHLADGCLIDLIRPDGTILREAAHHRDARLDAVMAPLLGGDCVDPGGPSGLPRVLRTGRPKLYGLAAASALDSLAREPGRRAAVRALGIRSLLIVPLVARGRTLGAITLLATSPGRSFSAVDLPTATELASLGALALDTSRLHDEAREAVRRRDEFLAMLAHELRNPMASIVSAAEVLRSAAPLGPGEERAVNVIARQSEQMDRLLGDLLDISRVTRDVLRLDRERVDLLDVLERSLPAAMPAVASAGHRLHLSIAAGPILTEGDAARLSQVVVNLLTNAARYTPRGGNIWLEVARAGNRVELVVRDDGQGIEPELLPCLFELFTQGPRGRDRSPGGLGIGLTLVKSIVERHGGSVSAFSAGPGLGSTFRVLLPLAEPAAGAGPGPGEDPPSPPRGGPDCSDLRILVVEDHDDNREMLRTLLALSGYRVETAADGLAGLEALRNRPDLALLDLGLPGLDGFSVARAARDDASLCDLPLIALTGSSRAEDQAEALAAGFDAHLVKPVLLDELQRLIDRFLRRGPSVADSGRSPASSDRSR
ncbi:ATP-binding protein [Tautonia sociabilis]|nr:ATP-binding protein [Tautonia sociabilis]